MEDLFLGKPIIYWIELQKGTAEKNRVELILEIADLRSKVSFYESRIIILNEFMQLKKEIK